MNTGYYTYLEGLSFEGPLNFQWTQVVLGACCFEHLKPERFKKIQACVKMSNQNNICMVIYRECLVQIQCNHNN